MIGSGLFGLTSAGQAQLAQVRAMAAVKKNEFDALPPDEKAAREFEDLMKRWPMNSWWRFFWTGNHLTKKLSNWRAELSNLCLATGAELLKSLATKKLKSNGLNVLLVQELLALVGWRVAKDTVDLFRHTE